MQQQPLTSEQRKAILDRQIDSMFAAGYHIGSRTDTSAVMIKGRKINHLLHFFVGLFTSGLWWIVWLFLGLTGGERETRVWVDELGELTQTHPKRTSGVSAALIVLPLLAIFLVLVGASWYLFIRSTSSSSSSAGPQPIPTSFLTATRAPAAKDFASPAAIIDATKPYIATLNTNKGDIQISLATDTPEAVNSFAFLAANGFYDGTAFFYVDSSYWAQAGDPDCRLDSASTCTGTRDAGYKLPLEVGTDKHLQWSVVAPGIAGGASQVSGGQFRILFAADERLDGQETVFGTVTKGREILQGAAFQLCTALPKAVPGCETDLSSALIIQSVSVAPAS